MPLRYVLEAAARFARARDCQSRRPPAESPGGVLVCTKCGATYLVAHVSQFANCEACGGQLEGRG